MTRIARIVVPGMAHHITQRGNNRQDVFFTDEDRALYLTLLKEESRRHALNILGYCLMSNHVHLVAVPTAAKALASALGRTHWRYARAINRLHGRCGHLWQNRFFSCPLDGEHLLHGMCYAERNPVRARIVRLAWRYAWSSAAVHAGEAEDEFGLLDLDRWQRMFPPPQWRTILQRIEDDWMTSRLRNGLHSGRPVASDRSLARLEARLHRRLRPQPVGRPRTRQTKGRQGTKYPVAK